jgi:hypothetical protein
LKNDWRKWGGGTLDLPLGRVERTLARIAKQAALANCICVDNIFVDDAHEFELEMNRRCPVHGFRSLAEICWIDFISPDRTEVEDAKLDGLIKIYEERRAHHSAAK